MLYELYFLGTSTDGLKKIRTQLMELIGVISVSNVFYLYMEKPIDPILSHAKPKSLTLNRVVMPYKFS